MHWMKEKLSTTSFLQIKDIYIAACINNAIFIHLGRIKPIMKSYVKFNKLKSSYSAHLET